MIRRNRAKSSSLFLMELILAILFFSIASAVCVQFFVKSHLLSQNAQELNYAVSECGSVAEIIDTSDSMSEALATLQELYPECTIASGISSESTSAQEDALTNSAAVTIYYNEDFAVCDESFAEYRLACELVVDDGNMLVGELSVTDLDASGDEASADTSVDAGELSADGEADAIYTLTVKHFLGRI